MKTETFYPQKISQQFSMEPMHDDYVESMELKDNQLIITYNHLLTEGVLAPGGVPYHQYDKLTITYTFDSYCDFIFRTKKKLTEVPFLTIEKMLHSKTLVLESSKYMIDNFGELLLIFCCKNRKTKKLYALYIQLDPMEITYVWEDKTKHS